MSRKLSIHLENVQETLLLPLWGRAVEAQKKKPLLIDTAAVDIINAIDYDFSTIARNINPISQLAWIARSLHIDRTIRQFLQEHPSATIVNIGCGFDTTFERVDNGMLTWYDLDLPDVIELRKVFLPEGERRKFLASSFLDDLWLHHLKIVDGIFFASAGVFYYFEEEEIKNFFIKLAGLFPKGEMLFDASSEFGVKVANKKVIEGGGMDKSAMLRWGCDSAQTIRKWDDRIALDEEYPLFAGIKRKLGFGNMIGTAFSDLMHIMRMIHLRFL
jgi:O-methyltransferase involved in polyketide biosynthesis